MSNFSNIDDAVRAAIQDVAVGPDRGRDISFEHAYQVMQGVLDNEVDPVQAAVVLIALRMKRESEAEMRGLTQAAQERINVTRVKIQQLVTLVDPFDGYSRTLSLTAFIPAVLAACGFPSVIHGVEAVGPKFGVTVRQVLQQHSGFKHDSTTVSHNIEKNGWAYIDQADYLPELYQLIALRNRIIKRTAITTFERVLAPVLCGGENHLSIGYVHKAYPEIYAAIAQQAGFDAIHLHKGVEGGLMIAANKPFARYSAQLNNASVSLRKTLHPESLSGNAVVKLDAALNIEAKQAQCYQRGLNALQGRQDEAYQSLLAACANIICSVDPNLDFSAAVEKARQQIDNGTAFYHFIEVVGK